MLVAVRLLTLLAGTPPPVLRMDIRRSDLDASTRALFESSIGAPIRLGQKRAALAFSAAYLERPTTRADRELGEYFKRVLDRALPRPVEDDDPLVARVRGSYGTD